jgi:hypothetical protein
VYLTNKVKFEILRDAPTRSVTCAKCGNLAEQNLLRWDAGFGLLFAGMHVAGKRAYGYVCPVCMEVSEVLTNEQARLLRKH